MSTTSARQQDVQHKWVVVDAAGQIIGRMCSKIAHRLRGKHTPIFTRHVDTGDFVIVLNAAKVVMTGKKSSDKVYYRHTGYPGGLKTTSFDKMKAKHPTRAIEIAIKGMLPKGPLGRAMFKKLKVYEGDSHPHAAQQPQAIQV